MTDATVWCEAGFDNFRGGGFSSHFVTRAEMPATMIRLNLVKGLGPVLQIAEGWTVKLPEEVTDTLMERTNPTWPCTWFTPRCDGKAGSPFESAYSVMQNWGCQPRRDLLWSRRCGPYHALLDAENPCLHAQRARSGRFPSGGMERFRHGQGRPGLPRLCRLRSSL